MKHYIFLLLFLPFPAHLYGQVAADSGTVLATVMNSIDHYYGNAPGRKDSGSQAAREKIVYRRAFQVNSAKTSDEVYNRALSFAGMMSAGYREDKKQRTIRIPVSWKYSGGANQCIEDLEPKGDIIIEVKALKTRISLININYIHRDKHDAHVKPVAKTDFFSRHPDCAPAAGKAELLYNCTGCRISIGSLDKSLQEQFDSFAGQYQERLKKY